MDSKAIRILQFFLINFQKTLNILFFLIISHILRIQNFLQPNNLLLISINKRHNFFYFFIWYLLFVLNTKIFIILLKQHSLNIIVILLQIDIAYLRYYWSECIHNRFLILRGSLEKLIVNEALEDLIILKIWNLIQLIQIIF